MKRTYFIIGILLFCLLFLYTITNAFLIKQIRIGNYWTRIDDNTSQGENAGAYRGFMDTKCHYLYWPSTAIDWAGWYLGCRDWVDENGKAWPVYLTGASAVEFDEVNVTIPVPDEEGNTIRKYMRYQPPIIIVDGYEIQDPFPLQGDKVAPEKIPGTADLMVTSTINTDMGVTIEQKVLAWSVKNHDDYIIWDWTFTNTGNIDLDDDIELPNQILEDFYFMRFSRLERWDSFFWYSGQGEFEEDTLRLRYAYPARRVDSGTIDDTGDAIATGNANFTNGPGFLWNPYTVGAAILHCDKSADDPTDDFNQPAMTGTENSDLQWTRSNPANMNPAADWEDRVYRVMSEGWEWRGNVPRLTDQTNPFPEKTIRPGYRSTRMEWAAVPGVKYITDLDWVTYGAAFHWAAGPYTLKPGESIRIVWADGFGVMNSLKIWEVGTDWENGVCEPPPGMTFDEAARIGLVDNMPFPYKNNPDLYNNNYNDWAKDCWVFTGIDSFIQNMNAAQWAVRNDYNVPIPPPPPSIEVTSNPDKIVISWGNESESAPDFAGYRLYRSEGLRYEGYEPGWERRDHGEWILVKDFPGSSVHSYNDTKVTRGTAYFYYVTAYDDGVSNGPDVKDSGAVLESGKYLNMTTRAAYLTREASSSLEDIVIVPNPYNWAARELQFPGEPDKIMFYELPIKCKIRIFTESGDLVTTIEHSGSGDRSWGELPIEHMTTETGQIAVSGLYIANIQTPDGQSINRKFVIIR